MRALSLRSLLAAVLLLNASESRSDDAAARQVIDRAVAAHGGLAKITSHKAASWNEKGTYYGMGNGLAYTGEYVSQWPTRFRMNIVGAFLMVVDGDHGWLKTGDATRDMTPSEVSEQRESLHASWITCLTPLNDPAYKLTLEPEMEVNGKKAVAVKVSRESRRDITLWFDLATNLLVKSAYIVKSPEMANKEVLEEVVVEQMQDVNGLKLPLKVVIHRGGKKFVEATLENYQILDQAKDAHFAKP